MSLPKGGLYIKSVIYLDVLLLVNFALAVLFLLAAGLICGVCCTAGRVVLGGAAAALSALALLAPEAAWPLALAYRATTCAAVVRLAYGWPGARTFARLTGWYALLNMLLAGAVLLPGVETNNGAIYLPLSPGALLAAAGAVWLTLQGLLRVLGRSAQGTFAAELVVDGVTLPVRAFVDTGFFVQEPLSGRAVVLVRRQAVEAGLSPALRAVLAGDTPPLELGVRFVPCTTVAGHCVLPAVPAAVRCRGHTLGGLYAAFCDTPPPPTGWQLLLGEECAARL